MTKQEAVWAAVYGVTFSKLSAGISVEGLKNGGEKERALYTRELKNMAELAATSADLAVALIPKHGPVEVLRARPWSAALDGPESKSGGATVKQQKPAIRAERSQREVNR